MGLIEDILQGLPVNSLLREQLIQLKAQMAQTETENAILKDDLRDAKAHIADLENQIQKLTQSDLQQAEIEILVFIAKKGYAYSEHLWTEPLNMPFAKAEYHLGRLRQQKYIRSRQHSLSEPITHELTQKGFAYVNENGLI